MTNDQKMTRLLFDATTMSHGKKKAMEAALAAFRLAKTTDDHGTTDAQISYALAFAASGGEVVNW